MSIIDRNIGKCANCGKEFSRERISKTTCSDACRKALSRKEQQKQVLVSSNLNNAYDAIEALSEALKIAGLSYDTVLGLGSLAETIIELLPDNHSQWHCKNCTKIITAKLPTEIDCECDNPQWQLQETML